MNKYDAALDLFADISLKENYANRPFYQERYNYATNKVSIIRISIALTQEKYEHLSKPDAGYVFNKPANRDKVFTLDGMKTLLNLIPKVNFEECDACDGSGRVDFEFEHNDRTYYHSADCPACGGTGKSESDSERRDFRYGIKFEIDTWPVKQKYLEQLIQTMELLSVDTARLVFVDTQIYKFELGDDVEVMFMGYHPDQKFEDFYVCYKGEERSI